MKSRRSRKIVDRSISLRWLRANATGKDVRVAVIDTGIDASHPVLKGRVVRACSVEQRGGKKITVTEIPGRKSRDSYGHGTAVAGIIADIAPEAEFVSVRVLNEYNSCTGDILIAGLKWALDRGIRLINMSLATSKEQFFPMIFKLCEQAYVQNVIIVASRRNFGDLGCPAMFSSVVSVDRNDLSNKWNFHFRARNMIEYDARGTRVRVPAPEENTQSSRAPALPHPMLRELWHFLSKPFLGWCPLR